MLEGMSKEMMTEEMYNEREDIRVETDVDEELEEGTAKETMNEEMYNEREDMREETEVNEELEEGTAKETVSYTHLTLPTKRIV